MLKYTIPILLLATWALQAQKTPKCTTYQQQVTIRLGSDGTAAPDPACVANEEKKGEVQWCSEAGNWSVDFEEEKKSPFKEHNIFHSGINGSCSRWIPVKKCVGTKETCIFKYNTRVNPDGKKDPDIEVEPGP